MSLKAKRTVKAAALGIVSSRVSPTPDSLSSAALRMMKIGLDRGLHTGYEGKAKAAACISVDFDVTSKERHPWNHSGTAALLNLSEDHEIPLTWAICGRTAEEDRNAYESILASSVKQDIGVHTYSHIYADECTEEEFRLDIERCVDVLGLRYPPTSFVFPKNKEGHFGLLKRLGFECYRGARRVIGAPVENNGLWNIRPVYYVDPRSIDAAPLIGRFVDACIARSGVFHLWTHPWSLAIDGKVDRMKDEVLEPVFDHLEAMRETGALSVTTMRGLASFMGPTT